jgi:photosystem II stability/assembly factor-like uncharacterized protein
MKYLLIAFICLTAKLCVAQPWTRINSLPGTNFNAMVKDNNMLYASTFSNTIFISPDNGASWTPSQIGPDTIIITCITLFNHKIYLGTDESGFFVSADTGRTWSNTNIHQLSIASFAEWRNNLYAATLGDGIVKLNQTNNTWSPFNNGLPGYSANVFKLINKNDTLIAAAGANGTYYRFNPLGAGTWDENYYLGSLHPNLLAENLVYSAGSMLITDNSDRLIRTDNGANWRFDTAGLRKGLGFQTIIGAGATNFYAAVNAGTGGTWIQKKSIAVALNDRWVDEGDFVPGGFTFAVEELNSKLYLLRSDGIYFKDVITAVHTPDPVIGKISIYPNPSGGRPVNVNSEHIVSEVSIVNLAGAQMFHSIVQKRQFTLPFLPNGLYIVQLTINKKVSSYRILIE